MKSKFFILAIALLLMAGCVQKEQEGKLVKTTKPTFPELKRLVLQDSIIISEVFQLYGMQITGGKVVFVEYAPSGFLSVYDNMNSELLFKWGSIGQGPSEFVALMYGTSDDLSEVVLYDIMKSSMFIYAISDSGMVLKATYPLSSMEDGLCKPYTHIRKINDSLFVMKADYPGRSELELMNMKTNKLMFSMESQLQEYRKERDTYTPFDFKYSSIGNTILSAYCFTDIIEVTEIQDETLTPKYIYENGVVQPEQIMKNNYPSVYLFVANDHINFYCLKTEGDEKQTGNMVEIYDKNGIPKSMIELDRGVERILFDDQNNLWGYKAEEDQTILYRWNYKL